MIKKSKGKIIETPNKKDANNIADKFRISGLGQLIEAGIQADRMITFGD